jgi:serine/threonine-protein kinase
MLTGRRAFEGDDITDTIAAVVRSDPNWGAIPPETPAGVVDIVRRCLAKDPGKRFGDVSVPLFLLSENVPAPPVTASTDLHDRPPLWKRVAPIAAAVLLTAAIAASAAWVLRPAPAAPSLVTRFTVTLPQGDVFTNTGRQIVDISRDGSQILYVAQQRLFLRGMGDLEPHVVPGSDLGGSIINPVLSPDGREIAFWYGPDNTIKRIAATGGAPVLVSATTPIFGMRWEEEGLVFGQGGREIARVSPAGGTPEVIAKVADGESASSPQLLPGGRGLLFSLKKTADLWDKGQVVVQTGDGSRKVLINGGADGRYVETGHLVYAVSGVLMAVPFDLERLEVTGGGVPIVEGVRRAATIPNGTATAQFSVATNGSLVYAPGPVKAGGEVGDRRLAIFDGKGGVEPLNMSLGVYSAPRASRDGKTVAYESGDVNIAVNVWVMDLDGKSAPRRLTFKGQNRAPVWSPDGQWIAFQSDQDGDLAIYRQRADGSSAAAERLTKPEKGIAHIPQAWSPDGAQLLFTMANTREYTLHRLSLADQKTSEIPDIRSAVSIEASFSPDGHWFVYQTRERLSDSGTPLQTFVQPFPPTKAKYLVPQTGGHPFWSAKGDRLMVKAGIERSMSVGIVTSPQVSFSPAVEFSRTGLIDPNPSLGRRGADALPDGRIIGVTANAQGATLDATPEQIVVVSNWFNELRARVR